MPKLYWIAHCGEHAIERTSCMVEVEHFTTRAEMERRGKELARLQNARWENVEAFTYGEIDTATGKEG